MPKHLLGDLALLYLVHDNNLIKPPESMLDTALPLPSSAGDNEETLLSWMSNLRENTRPGHTIEHTCSLQVQISKLELIKVWCSLKYSAR